MIFNKSMKIEHLLENETAVAVFDRFLPGMRQMAESNAQAAKLSVEQLVRYSRLPGAEHLLEEIDAALQTLNTPENAISPSEAKLIERFHRIAEEDKARPPRANDHHQDAIYPGQPWLDTKGERIHAHGGAVYYDDGVYYWYGENKEYTDGKNGVWTWGIKVYSSGDLCNWEDRGFLIPPVLDDPNSAMFPTKRIDRPYLLKCAKTDKYVCWIKLSGPEAAFTIWQADSLLGPYEMVENLYNPGGHKAGDFDLIVDEATEKGYLFFDADHSAMLCMELSEDYLHAEREAARSYPDLHPPFTREGPALFEADGKKYLLTSGMTGYIPNRSDSAVSDAWDKVFTSLGDPHVDDASCASFNSQISKVFKVEGREGLLIAMADRWVPDYPVDARIADLFTRVVASTYDPEHYAATDAERQEMYAANVLENANTSVSNYVWLPVTLKDGKPLIRWLDRWTPEEM
jgi:hypothetical protein